jgi:hypothetical protein
VSFIGISAGIGAASLGLGVAKSIGESNAANKLERNNPRPNYTIPAEYRQNYLLAQHMAQIGLPQQQYNNQLNGINQNQTGAINALSHSANPGAGLASIVRGGDNAVGNLNAQDAMARQQNQRFAIGQNGILGQQELAKQQYDKFDKYSENFNQAAADRSAANSNLNNAFNGASQLAGSLAMSNSRMTGYPGSGTNGIAADGSGQYGPNAGQYGFGNPAKQSWDYNNWADFSRMGGNTNTFQ